MPIRSKFQLAKVVLSGEPFDRGGQPYQDLDLLIKLRDRIAHCKPEQMSDKPHEMLKKLRARKVCAESKPGVTESWLGLVTTRATAR